MGRGRARRGRRPSGSATGSSPVGPGGWPWSAPRRPTSATPWSRARAASWPISPPWFRPRYEPSKRRLTWPNGAIATTFSADEPDRLRGPQHDAAWVDELAAFRYPAALDNLLFGLRLGKDPRLCVTTTPKPMRLVTELIADPTTAIARGTTYENRANLAPSFFERIVTKYEGTRLGQQEMLAEVLDVADGIWFGGFDPAKHVTESAEYDPRFPVHLAIDCGVSRHVARSGSRCGGWTPASGG